MRTMLSVVCFCSLILVSVLTSAAFAGRTEIITVAADGQDPDGNSYWPRLSADGTLVAYMSQATDLVPDDTNDTHDVFVRKWLPGITERVSVGPGGMEANNASGSPLGIPVSAEGYVVAFGSRATNLVPGDTNGCRDVFVRDRQMGVTERVSVSNSGEQANGSSNMSAISADGRFVAFTSGASNLVSGDINAHSDIFLRDRLLGTTELVSISSEGEQGNDGSNRASGISADGRFVAFVSEASNLVANDTNEVRDVFVHDRETGTTERVNLTETGQQSYFTVSDDSPTMSADGRFVTFVLGSPELVCQVYVRDRQEGITECISVNDDGELANQGGPSESPRHHVSADGRFVVFFSASTNLDPRYAITELAVFLRDRQQGTTELVSLNNAGQPFDGGSGHPTVSADGRFIAFNTWRANTAPSPFGKHRSVVLRDREGFADVPPQHWAYAEIGACADAGIVSGYPNGTYGPEVPVSRAQMAVFISRSICTPTGEAGLVDYTPPATPAFPDVATDHWAYKYIEYAAEHNIAGGYPDGLYQPGETVNRGQMAVFVARAMVTPSGDAAVLPGPVEPTFPDVTSSNAWAWCYDHVEHIAAQGVTQGYFDGYYHPEYTCTRAQMAVYVTRAFSLPM